MTDIGTWIRAVRSSHDRLAGLVRPLSETDVERPSYASAWSIADTVSHLGSQAEILGLMLDAGLTGRPAPGGDVFTTIWDRWNALVPIEQVRQSIEADEGLVSRVEQTSDDQRERFSLAAFGRELDLADLLAMRLAEHAVHTWDVAVALDDAATVAPEAVDLLVDELPVTVTRAGRVRTGAGPVDVVTTDPPRTFVLDTGDPVTLQPSAEVGRDPIELPAEALVRLVYGRLDPDHTPAGVDEARLVGLRTVFPGF